MEQILYFVLALIVVLAIVIYMIYNEQQQTSSKIATIQAKLNTMSDTLDALTANVDDIQTVTQLSSDVSGLKTSVANLQSNPLSSSTVTLTPSTNSTVTSVSSAAALTLTLNANLTLTHYTATLAPATSTTSNTAYIDIPLVKTVSQAYVVSNRGTWNLITSPASSANILNDIRSVISADGTTVRVMFTPNGTGDHQLSVSIISK